MLDGAVAQCHRSGAGVPATVVLDGSAEGVGVTLIIAEGAVGDLQGRVTIEDATGCVGEVEIEDAVRDRAHCAEGTVVVNTAAETRSITAQDAGVDIESRAA